MPRLQPSVIRHASRLNKHIPRLLHECDDIRSACNELRWMKEAILEQALRTDDQKRKLDQSKIWSKASPASNRLDKYVARRARGEPLQYILGSQPFGELDIRCRPQVLIPRGETEVYTAQLARSLAGLSTTANHGLKIADFCTGSGCIALLLYSLLQPHSDRLQPQAQKLLVQGFDISRHALDLARENLQHNVENGTLQSNATSNVSFEYADVLALGSMPMIRISANLPRPDLDVLVSNPPYISPQHFSIGGPTSRSVRKFEPKLALVPPETLVFSAIQQADQFYVALLRIALATGSKLLLMEVGDSAQALRIAEICANMPHHVDDGFETPPEIRVEIWRDDGGVMSVAAASECVSYGKYDIEYRAVVVWLDRSWISHRIAQTLS